MKEMKLPLRPVVLSIAVGPAPGPGAGGDKTLCELNFARLNVGMIKQIDPDEVSCWLFCAAYDATDIARLLHGAGFRGRLRVQAGDLPRPEMIRKELSALAPGVTIDIDQTSEAHGDIAAYRAYMGRDYTADDLMAGVV